MAKISTTTVIEQGECSIKIAADGSLNECLQLAYNINNTEELLQSIEDIEHILEVFKTHITDRH